MITKIKQFLIVSSSSLLLLFSVAVPATVSAACNGNIGREVAAGVDATGSGADAAGCDTDAGKEGLGRLARNVVNIFSYIVGFISVIMIIYGGFRYITSGGSSEGVGAAKSTLIYAIVGLIIVVLAQIIVQFVLSQSSSLTE